MIKVKRKKIYIEKKSKDKKKKQKGEFNILFVAILFVVY